MKKVLSLLLALLMLASATPFVSAAETLSGQAAAENLHALGLLAGVGKNADGSVNFDVGGKLTRAQAITQIVRFLGAEKTATASTYTHPFTDLPAWAVPYVGYAFENGITKGVSATKFGTDDRMGDAAFLTLILRVLGYKDAEGDFVWNNPYTLAKTAGLIDSETPDGDFTRGDAFVICYRAITATVKSGASIKEQLIGKGVFTAETFDKVAGKAPTAPAEAVTKLYNIKELNRNAENGSHASDDIATAMLEINLRESLELSSGTTGQARYDNAFYPRIKKIRDNLYLMLWMWGELGPHLLRAYSTDGVHWSAPEVFYRNEEHPVNYEYGALAGVKDNYCAVNADACVLDNGDVLCTYYVRPNKGYRDYPELNTLVLVRGTVTDAGTISWGEHKAIYHGQGWEPFIWQREDGIVEIYWSSPVAYMNKYGYDEEVRSAGVMMIQSRDNGFTWTPNVQPGDTNYYQATRIFNQYVGDRVPNVKDKNYTEAVPYFGGQMPAVTRLYNGKTLLAIEVKKLDGGFTMTTQVSPEGGNWKPLDMLEPTEGSDWTKNPKGAGPYLATFPSGEVYLTYHWANKFHGRMVSPDGMTMDSQEFITVPKGSGMWGASELVGSHEVITVAQMMNFTTKISGIALTHAYLNHRINAANLAVTVDGYTNEWEQSTDALFVGSETQAQMTVQAAHDSDNIYFLISRLDEYLTDGDTATLNLGVGKSNYYRVKVGMAGILSIEYVEGGAVKKTVEGGKAVVTPFGTVNNDADKDEGVSIELSIPKAMLGNPDSFTLSPQLSNQDGIGATNDAITGLSPFLTARWPAVILD